MVPASLVPWCVRDVLHMLRDNHTFTWPVNFQACHEGIFNS
jgi:hypothetical protein